MFVSTINRLHQRSLRLLKHFGKSALILIYHRVADLETDPFELAIHPQSFDEQIEIVAKYAQPISLAELLTRLTAGKVSRRSVVVTFDDGYADNLYAAKPILEKYAVPATIFISTTAVRSGTEFDWDALERLILGPAPLPSLRLLNAPELNVPLNQADVDLSKNNQKDFHDWRFFINSDPTPRHRLFREIYVRMRDLPADRRFSCREKLFQWARCLDVAREKYRPLCVEEVVRLAKSELIEIGGHTKSHPFLPALSFEEQRTEIAAGKAELEDMLGKSIGLFSYPYGQFNEQSVQIVQAAGYEGECAARPANIRANADRYRLPRVWSRRLDGEQFRKFLEASFVN